jgi:hypothetical protein
MKEAASSQSFWNVTDVNHLNEMLGKMPITELILLMMRSRWKLSIEPSNRFF